MPPQSDQILYHPRLNVASFANLVLFLCVKQVMSRQLAPATLIWVAILIVGLATSDECDMRIVGTSVSHAGRLEIRCSSWNESSMNENMTDGNATEVLPNETESSGEKYWLPVCRNSSLDVLDEDVLLSFCSASGVPATEVHVVSAPSSFLSSNNTPVFLTNVSCEGSNCTFELNPMKSCTQSCNSLLGLICAPLKWEFRINTTLFGTELLANPTQRFGRLEVRPLPSLPWGAVSSMHMEYIVSASNLSFAELACGTLERDWVGAKGFVTPAHPETPLYITQIVACDNANDSLANCTFDVGLGNVACHSESLGVVGVLCEPAWEYRLSQIAPRIGTLEARPSKDSAWGAACIPTDLAKEACEVVGLTAISDSSTYDSSRNPLFMAVESCESKPGGEIILTNITQLANASNSTAQPNATNSTPIALDNCRYSFLPTNTEAATCQTGLLCGRNFSWQYRLEGNFSAGIGLLKLRPTNDTEWGKICTDELQNHSVTENDEIVANISLVACRSLGFRGNGVFAYSKKSSAASQAYLNPSKCSSTASALHDCPSAMHTSHCSETNTSWGIVCGAQWEYSLSKSGAGLFMQRPRPDTPWGTMCSANIDRISAKQLCRAANFSLMESDMAVAFLMGNGSGPIYTVVSCSLPGDDCVTKFSVNSTAFDDSNVNCTHAIDLGLICGSPVWQVRIKKFTSNTSFGRMDIRPSNATPWGTVCSIGRLSKNALARACDTAGYPGVQGSTFTVSANESGTGPMYLSSISCLSNYSGLQNCSWETPPWYCSHSIDAGLDCGGPFTDEYRLVGGLTGSSGVLQVKPRRDFDWSNVCGSTRQQFSLHHALLACRAAGIGSVSLETVNVTAIPSSASFQDLYGGFICAGDETNLRDCFHTRQPYNPVPCSAILYVSCAVSNVTASKCSSHEKSSMCKNACPLDLIAPHNACTPQTDGLFESVQCFGQAEHRCIGVNWFNKSLFCEGTASGQTSIVCDTCHSMSVGSSFVACNSTEALFFRCSDSMCRRCEKLHNGFYAMCLSAAQTNGAFPSCERLHKLVSPQPCSVVATTLHTTPDCSRISSPPKIAPVDLCLNGTTYFCPAFLSSSKRLEYSPTLLHSHTKSRTMQRLIVSRSVSHSLSLIPLITPAAQEAEEKLSTVAIVMIALGSFVAFLLLLCTIQWLVRKYYTGPRKQYKKRAAYATEIPPPGSSEMSIHSRY